MIRLIEILAVGVTDDSGLPLSLGKASFYSAGTTSLETVFQDFDLQNPHPNPLTLDAAGRTIAYAADRVKIVLADADGTTIRTIDSVGTADSDIATATVSNIAGNGLTSDTDGKLNVSVDGTTITIASDELSVPDAAITEAKLADDAVTESKIADGSVTTDKIPDTSIPHAKLQPQTTDSIVLSGDSGNFSTNSGSYVDVTNLSVSFTTAGGIIRFGLVAASASAAVIYPASGAQMDIRILRDATVIYMTTTYASCPVGAVWGYDSPVAGTYTYKVQAKISAGTSSEIDNTKLALWR